jgi:phytoene desaturase
MKVSVVGAGIGGMITALLLERNGHDVTIYEKEQKLGGRLTFETNGKYKIDQGPTIVLLPDVLLSILGDAGIPKEKLHLIPCDPLYDMYFDSGIKLTKWRDIDKQAEEIEKNFPGYGERFLQYTEDMKQVYTFGFDAFLSKSFHKLKEFLSYENIRFITKSRSYLDLDKYVKKYFDHTLLKEMYSLQSLYIGGSPYSVPALYGLIGYAEHAFGIWYLKGGYASLIDIIEEVCIDRGITIHQSTKVTNMLIENEKVVGVEIENGDQVNYDVVIFNGEYPHLNKMLPKSSRKKEKKYKPSSGCLLAYVGVKKRFYHTTTHQFFMPDDFSKHMEDVFVKKKLTENPSCYVFNPITIDHEAAPENESVLYLLIPVPATDDIAWDEVKEQIVLKQLERIEKQAFPGLMDAIDWLSIRSPKDAKESGLYGGGSFGIAPHLSQSGGFRPQLIHPSIQGLYAVGASVHPGGGIPIVMQGAKLLAEYINQKGS